MKKTIFIVIALLAWLAVLLQYYVLFQKPALSGMNVVEITFLILNYFTILTNLLVAISATISVVAPETSIGRFLTSTNAVSAIAVYIALVGLIFNVVLRSIDVLVGFTDILANELTHLVVPVLYIVFWLVFVPKGELNWRQPIYWLIYPAFYLPWVLIYGALTGRYPYPFVHVGNLGYPAVLLNSLGLFVLCLVVGWIFVGIDKLMGKKDGKLTAPQD